MKGRDAADEFFEKHRAQAGVRGEAICKRAAEVMKDVLDAFDDNREAMAAVFFMAEGAIMRIEDSDIPAAMKKDLKYARATLAGLCSALSMDLVSSETLQ